MPTSNVLQTPTILSVDGSSIRIKHPDVSQYTRTSLTAPFTAGGTTLTSRDTHNLADDDWLILGESGHAKTEEVDVNQANISGTGQIARGTSITITNTTDFSHEIDTPVIKIWERGIKIYGAATNGGAGTLIESVDALTAASANQLADAVMIRWDKPFTDYTMISTDTEYAFYYVVFTDGTTDGSSSDYVAATGPAYNSGRTLVQSALNLTNTEVDGQLITWEYLLTLVNDFQQYVSSYSMPDGSIKDWPYEIFEDLTSITLLQNENEYAVSSLSSSLKYPDSNQGVIQVKVGASEIQPIDLDEYERQLNGKVRTEVATQAAIGATSMVLDDTAELADDGDVYLGTQTAAVSYTSKTDSTNTISGIPASGTGSITATATVDTVVWQNLVPAIPDKYTIFNSEILLNTPPNSDAAGWRLKVKAYAAPTRVSSLVDTIPIPFTHIAKWYIGAEIEYRKKNKENGDRLMARFEKELLKQATRELGQMPEVESYYTFTTHLQSVS